MPDNFIILGPNGETISSGHDLPEAYPNFMKMPDSNKMLPSASGLDLIKHLLQEQKGRSEWATLGLPLSQGVNARSIYYTRRAFLGDLYVIYHSESVLKAMVLHRRDEAFRRGFDEWKPAFVVKCPDCGEKYSISTEECQSCLDDYGLPVETTEPDPSQKIKFDAWMKYANEYGQTLRGVLEEAHEDALIVDDAFLWLQKDYFWGFNHKTHQYELTSELRAIRRMEPELMEFDLDPANRPKRSHYICPLDRSHISTQPAETCPQEHYDEHGRSFNELGIPPPPLRASMYRFIFGPDTRYFTDDEIIHYSIFHGSPTYGYPSILTIYEKELSLIGMDMWVYRYFYERKIPPGAILVNTDDPDSLRAITDKIKNEMSTDPANYMPIIGVSQKTGRGGVNFVRFFHTLQEMEYGPMREQIQQMLGMFYGVSPIWQNVTEGVGGISGQTQQLVVMSRKIETDQNILNNIVLDKILFEFGVTDWVKRLKTPEQKTEETLINFNNQKAQFASSMQALGFEILSYHEENGEVIFKFSDKPKPPEQLQQEQMGGAMPAESGGGEALSPEDIGAEGNELGAENGTVNYLEGGDSDTVKLSGDQMWLKQILNGDAHSLPLWKQGCNAGDHVHPGISGCHKEDTYHRDPKIRHGSAAKSSAVHDSKGGNKSRKSFKWRPEFVHSSKTVHDLGVAEGAYNIPHKLVTFKDGTHGLYKTQGISPNAEKLAYIVSQLLSLNNVPNLENVSLQKDKGLLYDWIDGKLLIDFELDDWKNILSKHKKVRFNYLKLAALDYIIGIPDRNAFNAIMDRTGNIWAINNIKAFTTDFNAMSAAQLSCAPFMKVVGFIPGDYLVLHKLLKLHQDDFKRNILQYAGKRIVSGILRRYQEALDMSYDSSIIKDKS